jgi:hypothetical protein
VAKKIAHNGQEDLLRVRDIPVTKLLRTSEGRLAHCIAI